MKMEAILRDKGFEVATISGESSVLEAVAALVERNIGSLVIVDGQRPAGILTERDILRLTARSHGELARIKVGAVMTRDLITATLTDDLHEAMSVMTENKIRHLPVLEGERIVGIVSIGDLVNACRTLAESENVHLRAYIQGGD